MHLNKVVNMPKLGFEIQRGEPVTSRETVVTPLAKTFKLPIPAISGGLVWNRPYAIEVRTADGNEWSLPVPDVTRQAQIALLAMGLIGVLLIGLVSRKR
jgi:hypothetical protein